MTAVCGMNGQWTPNLGGVTCSPRPTPTFTHIQADMQDIATESSIGPVSNTLLLLHDPAQEFQCKHMNTYDFTYGIIF